ncbi:MAG TPA: oligosaccharide flippase family protein [Cryomorphaceae bacterium]|nr:oligosaccharide flippase family protein [Cryomorphaceae bacterium]
MIKPFLARLSASSDERSKRILRHIIYSAGLKFINAGVSFLVIPIYLELLTEVSFGIWLTVSAVINWFNFFDLGLGNGLRNRFAQAKAEGNDSLAARYVSTSYALIGSISGAILIIFLIADQFFQWSAIFAAPGMLADEVNQMVFVLVVLFCPQFVLQLIKMIVTADQRPALSNLMNTIVNVLQLGALFFLSFDGDVNLPELALYLGGINLLVPIFANFFLFSGMYSQYRPRLSFVDFSLSRKLLGLGMTFFILQGAALVVFMTDNLIITHVLGPEEVPAYNISYRYFNLAAVVFGLITTPFWSAFTEAYVKKDMAWIKKVVRRLLLLWLVVSLVALAMFFAAPLVYSFWIGDTVTIPGVLNFFMMVWVILSTFLSIFGTFLSGLGKLKISVFHAVFIALINIPLSIYLAGFPALGSAGVILASILGTCFRLFFQPLQTFKIIRGTARGIWNR